MDGPKNASLPPAVYVNFLRVAHQQSEFFFAFGQAQAQQGAAHLASSLVTTPVHAKAMLEALAESVRRFEERFGEIPAIEPAAQPLAEVPRAGSGSSAGRGRQAKRG